MTSGKTIDWDEGFYVRTESERKQSLQRLLDALPNIGDLNEEKADNDITSEEINHKRQTKSHSKESNDDFKHVDLIDIAILFQKDGKSNVAAELAKKIMHAAPERTIASMVFLINQRSILSQTKGKIPLEKFNELLEIIRKIDEEERKKYKNISFNELYINICLMKFLNCDGAEEKTEILTHIKEYIKNSEETPRILNYTFAVQSQIARINEKGEQKIRDHYKALKYVYEALKKDNKNLTSWNIILTNIEKIINFSNSKRESLSIIESISRKINSYIATFDKNPYLIHSIANLYVKKAEVTTDEAEQEAILSKAEKMLDVQSLNSRDFNKVFSNTLKANICIIKACNELTFYKKIALLNEAVRLCEEHISKADVESDTFAHLAHAYRELSEIEKDTYRKRVLLEQAIKEAKHGIHVTGCHMLAYNELSLCYEKLSTLVEAQEEAINYKTKSIQYKKQIEEHRI